MKALVRAACLTNYVEVARAGGLDPWRLLHEEGLPARCVQEPDLRISADAVRSLLERSAALSGIEGFGLLLAEGRRLSNLGVLGMLAREEPTLRAALGTFGSYSGVHNEAIVQTIEEAGGIAVIRYELLLGTRGSTRQAMELVVAITLRVIRSFLGPQWRARRVCFRHAPPSGLTVHRRVLGQTPEFGQEFDGIVCRSADLDTPITTADPEMARYVKQQLQAHAGAIASATGEVRQMLMLLMPQGRCTIDQVARLMGITRRTLHRRLAQEGCTFSGIVQDVRHELAARLIPRSGRALGDISASLGFSNASSFSRWYRTRFGETAEAARRRVYDGASHGDRA